MKKFVKVLICLVILAAVVGVFGAVYTVKENQYAAVMQFGKIVRVDETAGLKIKIPFIQTVTFIPKSIQINDTAASDVITEDKKSMIADNYTLWKVTDPIKFAQTLSASTAMANDRTSVATYNATKNIISSMTQDEVIAARGEKLTTLITEDANRNMGNYGIEIVKTEIKSLDLPEDNKEAVYERMISERNNIAASYLAEGEREAKEIRNKADRDVEIEVAQARSQAEIIKAEGDAEYMRILSEAYDSSKKAEFYTFMIALDAMKKSMNGEKTLILGEDSPLAELFN